MRRFAVVLLLAALGATGASSSVTVQTSSIGFKQALAACPSGTLGAISFTLNHLRVAEAAGVASDIDSSNVNAQTVMFSTDGHSATVFANAVKRTVSAKHVTLASSKRVACVAPD
jgi:hypothetical protein